MLGIQKQGGRNRIADDGNVDVARSQVLPEAADEGVNLCLLLRAGVWGGWLSDGLGAFDFWRFGF